MENGLVWCPEGSSHDKIVLASKEHRHTHSITAARFGIDGIDNALPYGGLSTGNIHEFFVGSLEPVHYLPTPPLGILSQITANAISTDSPLALWIGKNCWPSPFVLQACAASQHTMLQSCVLQHCVFIDPPNHRLSLWATEAALRHGGIRIVISALRAPSFTTTRRLSLAAARGNSVGILIRSIKEQDCASTAHTRWIIRPVRSASAAPCWQVQLIQSKGPRPQKNEWVIEDKGGRYEEIEYTLPGQSAHLNKTYAAA